MTAVVAQIRAAQHDKKNKYEYDSDEDTEGGTWEHKLRTAEMHATKGKSTNVQIYVEKASRSYFRPLSCV